MRIRARIQISPKASWRLAMAAQVRHFRTSLAMVK
jgi:hypothetical protein